MNESSQDLASRVCQKIKKKVYPLARVLARANILKQQKQD